MNRDMLEESLGGIFILLIVIVVLIAITNRKGYEYYANGKIGKSTDCYQTSKLDCYCKTDNGYIKVENYVAE